MLLLCFFIPNSEKHVTFVYVQNIQIIQIVFRFTYEIPPEFSEVKG